MSMRESIRSEFSRAPMQVIGAGFGILAALHTMVILLVSSPSLDASGLNDPPHSGSVESLNLANIMLVVGIFVSVTTSLAIMLRLVARRHNVGAFFASIPALALSNFATIVLVYVFPPRPLTQQLFSSAQELTLFGSILIIASICGKAVVANLMSPEKRSKREEGVETPEKSDDSFAGLIGALVMMVVWGWLISTGQVRLTETFLPDITHNTSLKSSTVGSN